MDEEQDERDRTYPRWLKTKEQELVVKRRSKCAATADATGEGEDRAEIGLALSGGGIRSATFALGVMQAMARANVLRLVDYLSTVSGGGYAGVFWGGLFIQGADRGQFRVSDGDSSSETGASPATKSNPATAELPHVESQVPRATAANSDKSARTEPSMPAQVESRLAQGPGRDSWEVSWLRENGRYLIPGQGSGLLALAVVLRNWFSVLVSLLVPSVTVFLLGCGLRAIPWQPLTHRLGLQGLTHPHLVLHVWWSPLVVIPGLFVLAALPCGCAYWLVPNQAPGMKVTGTKFALATLCLMFLSIAARLGPWLVQPSPATLEVRWLVAPSVVALVLIAALALRSYATHKLPESIAHQRHWLTVALKNLLVLIGASAAFAVIDSLGQTLYALYVRDPAGLGKWFSAFIAPAAAIAAFGPRLSALVGHFKPRRTMQVPLDSILLVCGLAVATLWLVVAAALAHACVWRGLAPAGDPGAQLMNKKVCDGVSCASSLDWGWWLVCLFVFAAVSYLLSQVRPFLNQSSLSMFYAARLTRTFLGASNRERQSMQKTLRPKEKTRPGDSGPTAAKISDAFDATEPMTGDEISTSRYRPHENGGPLHIINITLNETIDARTSSERRDGQAMSFALGPVALSVGVRQHAERDASVAASEGEVLRLVGRQGSTAPSQATNRDVPPSTAKPASEEQERQRFTLFPTRTDADALTIGTWIAISGAAVAPGLGARSSLGAGLLTVLFNLRLGHWWYSGTDPYQLNPNKVQSSKSFAKGGRVLSRSFPVLAHLLDELSVRFHGTARRHWYLSDGGHFENTACYELLRRELPLIICSDAGADPDYAFADVGNLVRRARLDFGANIEFLNERQRARILDPAAQPCFGSLAELGRVGLRGNPQTALSTPHAALAAVKYANQRSGLLILLKPTLTGDEPYDLTDYAANHDTFPQESTADQFFDESQWESYRKLGDHIGTLVFGEQQSAKASLLKSKRTDLQTRVDAALLNTPVPSADDAVKTGKTVTG